MKRIAIVAAVVAQIVILAAMAVEREWVLAHGKTIFLRTAPIDPDDPMRGKYVRLNYEAGFVPRRLCRDGVIAWFGEKDERRRYRTDHRVYAQLELDQYGVARVVGLSDRRPDQGLFIRGRTTALHSDAIEVRYGVEAFFMEQGKAKALETAQFNEKQGVPLNMEIAVGGNGLTVLKNYRWEPLGITVQLDRNPTQEQTNESRPGRRRPGLRGITVILKNHSDQPQAIVADSDSRSLRIVAAARPWAEAEGAVKWEAVSAGEPPQPLKPEDIVVLAPGATHQVHLDFASPKWFVREIKGRDVGPPVSIETLAERWDAVFRIEYSPPDPAACIGLPNAEKIRHATIRSRQFNTAGGGD
jgi:uncharacterized membrane-anchored protein